VRETLDIMMYLYLGIAIVAEVFATSFLKKTDGFTVLWPSVLVIIGYLCAFYFLSLTLKTMHVGVMYAIWCGLGSVLIAIAGVIFYNQKIDLAGSLGIALILLGVIVINLFSKTVTD
jgi:small multidrug resistance pump